MPRTKKPPPVATEADWKKYIDGMAPKGKLAPEPLPALDTVEGPKDRAAFVNLVNKAVSRGLSLATTPKEVCDAVKAATWWFKVCYDVKEDEPYGGALGGADA